MLMSKNMEVTVQGSGCSVVANFAVKSRPTFVDALVRALELCLRTAHQVSIP